MATQAVQSVIDSWKRRAPLATQAGVPSGYVSKIAADDIKKAMSGGSPMTSMQAGVTFKSIIDGQGQIQEKKGHGILDLPGNAFGDLKDVATGILPGIANEVTHLPGHVIDFGLIMAQPNRQDIRDKYGMSKFKWNENPLEALRNVAKMPIIGYTPALHTAANLTTPEGRKNIMENPLITALDVLPAAKGASKLGAAGLGITAAKDLGIAESAARASAIKTVTEKLAEGKAPNLADIAGMPTEGLNTIMADTKGIPSDVANKVRQELLKRERGQSVEPSFTPSTTYKSTTLIPDPEFKAPFSDVPTVPNLAPEETSAIRTVLNQGFKSSAIDIGNGIKKLSTDGADHYGIMGPNDTLKAFLSVDTTGAKPLIDMVWRDPELAGGRLSSRLYKAAEADGVNIADAATNGMTDAGRAARANYLGIPTVADLVPHTTDVTVPLEAAAKGSTAEALALGQPIKALSRATGISDRVIQPIAERLGTTQAMTELYKAVAGTLPRKYQPQLEAQLKSVGDELADHVKLLDPEKQVTFYKDIMAAAMESADTVKAANLAPEMLTGINILRGSTAKFTDQLVNAGEVVAIPLPEGGTALFSKTNSAVRAWQKIEAHLQRKPEGWTKDSVLEQNVKWTRKAQTLRSAYERSLNNNAPLAFQNLIEQRILNQLALKMMAPEMATESAIRASAVVDKLKAGTHVNQGDVQSMSVSSLNYLKGLGEDITKATDTLGHKVPNRVYTQVMKELELRTRTGNPGPMDIMSPQMVEQITQKIRTGDYLQYMSQEELDSLISNSTEYWRKLKAQGYDPVPVPYLSKSTDLTKNTFIQPVPEGMSVSELDRFRSAVFDFKPYQDDLAVSLSREAVEQLRYDATRDFHQNYVTKLARNPEEVLGEYSKLHPDLSRAELRDQILKDYVPYDGTADHPFRAEWKQGVNDSGAQLLPKPVSVQLHNLVKRDALPVKGVVNRVNKTFRFAVLTSPRHVAHIAGGGLTQMLLRDPMSIFDIREGIAMVKEGRMPIDLPQGIDGFTANEVFNYAGGRTIGRIAKEAHGKFRGMEEFLANTLKSTDYLFNKKSALRQGMTETYAHGAGIEAAGKALAVFEDMSPFERQYIRTVMPFYGFTKHLTKYLLSYPADHPYKAAILSQIVNREFEDWNTGLPRKWNQLFFMGKPNESGDITGIDFKSLNPFRNVYNNFSLAGMLSQSTPWIGGPMAFMGINPTTGSGELYPDLSYDPATGNLVTKRKGGVLKLAQAFVPQISSIDHMFKFSADMRNLAKNNPQAYRQQMYSTLGIPFEPVHVNIPTTVARTQKNQLRVATQTVDDALNGLTSTDRLRKFTVVPFHGQMMEGSKVADYIDQLQGLIKSNPQLQQMGIVPKTINPKK